MAVFTLFYLCYPHSTAKVLSKVLSIIMLSNSTSRIVIHNYFSNFIEVWIYLV